MTKDILRNEFIDLEPCPFCGCPADFGDRQTKRYTVITVGCTNMCCFCRMEQNLITSVPAHKVIKAFHQDVMRWNTRKGNIYAR